MPHRLLLFLASGLIACAAVWPRGVALADPSPSQSRDRNAFTVRLKDGTVLRDVRIAPDWRLLIVAIHEKGQLPRNVSFDEIDSVVDTEGRDATAHIIGPFASAAPTGDEATVRHSIRPAPMLRQTPWKVGLVLTPTYAVPFGTWFQGTKSHAGARSALSIVLSRDIGIDLAFQHQPLGVRWSQVESFETQSYSAEARYLVKLRGQPLWGYGTAGMGGFRHRASWRADTLFPARSFSGTKLLLTSSYGLIYLPSNRLGLDVGMRLNQLGGASGYVFEVNAGVVVPL